MKRLIAITLLAAGPALAADHVDAPGTQADPAADIADLYAWYEGNDVRLALTFDGLRMPADGAGYDPDVLYQIKIDNTGDTVEDFTINARFGQNESGEWGVQVTGIPGTNEPIVEEVGESEREDGARIWAGLREDPFFFDFTGFNETTATGDLAFDNTRDFFAGTNVIAIVVEFDRDTVAEDDGVIAVWATSSRIGS